MDACMTFVDRKTGIFLLFFGINNCMNLQFFKQKNQCNYVDLQTGKYGSRQKCKYKLI